MASGLIFGALAQGLGAGGNKYLDLEEKQRAEEAQHQQRFQEMDLASRQREGEKDADQKRKTERMMAFRQEAEAWRQANPKAPMEDFINHFAQTEHADLLGPTLQAAGYKRQAEIAQAQIEHYKAQEKIAEKSAARADKSAGLQDAAASRAERRLALEEEDVMEKRAMKKKAQGLLAGYMASEGNPVAQQAYRKELRIIGADPEAKDAGTTVRETKGFDPKTGQETVTKETLKDQSPERGQGAISGAVNTGERYNGRPLFIGPDGKVFYYGVDGTPRLAPAEAAAQVKHAPSGSTGKF